MNPALAPMLAALVSFTTLGPAEAVLPDPVLPPAPFRVAPEGTVMIWTRLDGFKTERGRIGATEGKLVHFTWEGEPRKLYLFCIRCASDGVTFDRDAYAAIFPLHTGKSVEFARRIGQWRWVNRIAVVGTERLSLPFGEVDTYVVLSETRGVNNPFHARNKIWFAPSIGWNVRFEYSDSRGVSYAWQAIQFQPP